MITIHVMGKHVNTGQGHKWTEGRLRGRFELRAM